MLLFKTIVQILACLFASVNGAAALSRGDLTAAAAHFAIALGISAHARIDKEQRP